MCEKVSRNEFVKVNGKDSHHWADEVKTIVNGQTLWLSAEERAMLMLK